MVTNPLGLFITKHGIVPGGKCIVTQAQRAHSNVTLHFWPLSSQQLGAVRLVEQRDSGGETAVGLVTASFWQLPVKCQASEQSPEMASHRQCVTPAPCGVVLVE